MSARICHVRQARKASSLESVRLVFESLSGSKVETWETPGASDFPGRDIEAAAEWIRSHVAGATDRAPGLDLLCLDVEGSLCSWVSSPSRDGEVLSAVARNFGADPESSSPSVSPVAIYAQSQLESSVQAIGESGEFATPEKSNPKAPATPLRTPILVSSEAPARLLLDALDQRRVTVSHVASFWQVMAAAWDPSAGRPADSLSDSAIPSACVVVDPAGRVLWAWSIKGVLLAAGAIRTHAMDRGEILSSQVAARLATEWLAWSAQVGISPQRVLCLAIEGDPSASEFGAALTQAWPGAVVDLNFDEDPMLATLRRAARVLEDQSGAIAPLHGLDSRPGRVHRSMYYWLAIAIVFAAAAIAALAFKFSRDAAGYKAKVAEARELWQGKVKETLPAALTSPSGEIEALKDEVARRERSLRPAEKAEPAFPVMEVFENVSMVLSTSSAQLDDITIDTANRPLITVTVTNSEEAEALVNALKAIDNPYISNWDPTYVPTGSKIQARIMGTWSPLARTGGKTAPGGGQ